MILNKENTFTEQNRFLVYSDQLNATRKQILDTAEEMISRSAIQTFEDEGETVTATDASYLASLTVDGKAVQNGTPTPSNPVEIQVVQAPDGGTFGISVNGTVTPINLNGNVLASLPDGTKDVLTVDSVGHCVLEKRVGVVDLGTLNWTSVSISSGVSGFYSDYISDRKISTTAITLMCEWYKAVVGIRTNIIADLQMAEYNGNNTRIAVRNDSYTDAAALKTAMSGVLLYYKLVTPQTIDLGYIDMPAIPDGSTISITAQVTPTIAVKWWTKNQSDVAAAFSAVSSDLTALQSDISALDARVTALESANAKTLVLEKLESSKEVSDEEEIEQEEMPLGEE